MPTSRQVRLYLKPAAFAASLAPLAWLVLQALEVGSLRLGPNPVEDIQDELGIWAVRFIVITLAITPLRRLTGWNWLMRLRRMFGLFAFSYAALHFANYLLLDQTLDLNAIVEDIIERPFITVGFAGLLTMVPLAITSTDNWRRRLGTNWRTLHRLVYATGILACWHFYWQVKKDVTEPMIYIVLVGLLLGTRLWSAARRRG